MKGELNRPRCQRGPGDSYLDLRTEDLRAGLRLSLLKPEDSVAHSLVVEPSREENCAVIQGQTVLTGADSPQQVSRPDQV
jgi:hypothetical protein